MTTLIKMGKDRKIHSSDIFYQQFLLYFQRSANRNHYSPAHNLGHLHNQSKVEASRNLRLLKGIRIKKGHACARNDSHILLKDEVAAEAKHPLAGTT